LLSLRTMTKSHIAIFASGSGTNAEEIIKHFKQHSSVSVDLILTNNPNAFVIERAKKFELPFVIFNKEEFKSEAFMLEILSRYEISHIVLAGFLWLIPSYLTQAFPDRIINVHPALLPKHGGKGMYGMKVHDAVKSAGDRETGITIHLVNEHYDEGKILFQASCPVDEKSTSEEIAKCVHKLEYEHYPKVIEKWIAQTPSNGNQSKQIY
jgi:phosphoribosylglycinamide formyltransferase-1